ncbi:GNAT family N-acetyltransferase [Streptomyces sp. B21-105]|uniref:GNAT family N-acetyltransferase n=1 Tax=Streptomyces sp. B21-105 TaxID=3039417 RepID=UPI002FF2ED8D
MEDAETDAGTGTGQVRLVPWSEGDFWLLRRTNSPEMTGHLGGPESEEKLADRHRRYLELPAGRMYRIVSAADGETRSVGSIGYWGREWRGEAVWETGWAILPEFQGRGLAAQAARALVDAVRRADGGRPALHAFPAVDHAASNWVCRKAGFTLLGEVAFEYPRGNPITSNDWYVDLRRRPTPTEERRVG